MAKRSEAVQDTPSLRPFYSREQVEKRTGYVRMTKAQFCILLPFSTAEKLDRLAKRLERSISQSVELLVEEHWRDEDLGPEVAFAILGPHERRGRPRKRTTPRLSLTEVRNRKVERRVKKSRSEG